MTSDPSFDFIVDNAVHSTCMWSEWEIKLFPLAIGCLENCYSAEHKTRLQGTNLVFPASLTMTSATKRIRGNNIVKVDVNAFRLQNILMTINRSILKNLQSSVVDQNNSSFADESRAFEAVVDQMFLVAAFRTGSYGWLKSVSSDCSFPSLNSDSAGYSILPGIVFALSHELEHLLTPDPPLEDILFGNSSGNFDHIIKSSSYHALDFYFKQEDNLGVITSKPFVDQDLNEIPANILMEIQCDLSAVVRTIAALFHIKVPISLIFDSIIWTIGVEALISIAEALVSNDFSLINKQLRAVGIRDMCMIAMVASVLKGHAPDSTHKFLDNHLNKLLFSRRFLITIIGYNMVAKWNKFSSCSSEHISIRELEAIISRSGFARSKTQFLIGTFDFEERDASASR